MDDQQWWTALLKKIGGERARELGEALFDCQERGEIKLSEAEIAGLRKLLPRTGGIVPPPAAVFAGDDGAFLPDPRVRYALSAIKVRVHNLTRERPTKGEKIASRRARALGAILGRIVRPTVLVALAAVLGACSGSSSSSPSATASGVWEIRGSEWRFGFPPIVFFELEALVVDRVGISAALPEFNLQDPAALLLSGYANLGQVDDFVRYGEGRLAALAWEWSGAEPPFREAWTLEVELDPAAPTRALGLVRYFLAGSLSFEAEVDLRRAGS